MASAEPNGLVTGRGAHNSIVPANRLGLGCAPIGGLFTSVTEQDAYETVHAAYAEGIRFFDTAPHYSAGISERRVGAALADLDRDTVTLVTKVGRVIVDSSGAPVAPGECGDHTVEDLTYDGVMRSLESSLLRMGVDRVDLVYLHDPTDVDVALDGAFKALQELRAQGMIKAIGVGMNFSAPLARYAAEADPDVLMVAGRFTLLDRSAQEDLLPVALDRGVSLIGAGVFNTGILANPVDGAWYNYRAATADELAQARALQQLCVEHGVTLPAAAIQFPLQHPAFGGVVVGARTASEVQEFVRNAHVTIPPQLWSKIDQQLGF